jgi:hypothetical protein
MGFELHLGVRAKALIVGIIGGFAGVAIDIDHIPQYLFNMRISPIFVIQGLFDHGAYGNWTGRAIHPLVLYICLAAFICITGLLLQYSVRSTARSVAKSVVTTVQNAFIEVPARE